MRKKSCHCEKAQPTRQSIGDAHTSRKTHTAPTALQLDCRVATLLAMTILWTCPAHALPSLDSVTIMADSTMSLALAELARNYSREHQIVVSTSFAAPKVQETQITEGAAADLLITPTQSWIDRLKTQGLVDVYSQMQVARNRLALVGPEGSTLQASLLHGFPATGLIRQMEGEPGFVVGNPETLSEGTFGKEALRSYDVSGDLEPYTLYIKERGQMFDMVAHHNAYGLFFYSTVINRPGMRVIGLLPESSHKPVTYYAVVIAGDHMNEARKFLAYLSTSEAKQLFRESGFVVD